MLIKSERKEKPQLRAESPHFAHQSGVTWRRAPYQRPPSKKNWGPLHFSTLLSTHIPSQWCDWQLWLNLRPEVQLHGRGVKYMSPITDPSSQK